jgi:cytochrome c biogenesis protein CcmG/thiol:disulfide interchange protein DsbE
MFTRYSVVLTALTLQLYGASKEPAKVELNLKDMNGRKVRLRDLRGKAVVLNFWATWCGPCKAELPMLVEAAKNYESRGVVCVAVSLDDEKTKQLVPAFVSAHQISFPVWLGATGDDLAKLGLGEAVPATAFVDQDGHISSRILGQLRQEDLKERLDWLTGDKTGTPPEAVVKHLENGRSK